MITHNWQYISEKFSTEQVHTIVVEYDEFIDLEAIETKDKYKGNGFASNVMNKIVQYAKENNKVLVLYATSEMGGNVKRLKEFYKRFGFVEGTTRVAHSKHNMYLA